MTIERNKAEESGECVNCGCPIDQGEDCFLVDWSMCCCKACANLEAFRVRRASLCECGKGERFPQYDRYGIYCGKMCDECYEAKYACADPEWQFDPGDAGESLDY